jgi:protein-S-isoprenylcysteine O-methyltransferase Ste14
MAAAPKYASRLEAARLPVSRVVAFAVVASLLLARPLERPELIEQSLRVLGLALAAVGAVGRQWCSIYIGGRKTRELVTAGPYSCCRNPLYLFSFIGAAGVALATHSFAILAVVMAFLWLYYPGVIRSEEGKLHLLHGEAFTRYRAATPALWPRRWRLRDEAPQQVDGALFRKHALEAMWFVWAVGLVLVVESLHEAELLPNLFSLY